jgi:hypothetical protein
MRFSRQVLRTGYAVVVGGTGLRIRKYEERFVQCVKLGACFRPLIPVGMNPLGQTAIGGLDLGGTRCGFDAKPEIIPLGITRRNGRPPFVSGDSIKGSGD